jgi:4'-phosphopantetheinyl transferase
MDRDLDCERPGRLEARAGCVDVWLASVPQGGDDPADLAKELVTPDEFLAAGRFRRLEDRRRHLVSRALLRTTLSRYGPIPALEWRFRTGAHGRPAIDPARTCGIEFSLAHTDRLVVVAVTAGDTIGVDAEEVRDLPDLDELAATALTPDEREALATLPQDRRSVRFLRHWTLKEAWLKAIGLGLALDPRGVAFDLSAPGRIRLRAPSAPPDRCAWWFSEFGSDGHLVAVAVRRPEEPRARVFRVDPACASPVEDASRPEFVEVCPEFGRA